MYLQEMYKQKVNKYMIKNKTVFISLLFALVLSGCAAPGDRMRVGDSYLEHVQVQGEGAELVEDNSANRNREYGVSRVPTLSQSEITFQNDGALSKNFSDRASLSFATENMPLRDFVHHVFGDLLKVNYIVGSGVAEKEALVTINVQEAASPRNVFTIVERELLENGIGLKQQNDLYYVYLLQEDRMGTAVGYGRSPELVPNALNVVQITPLRFNFNNNSVSTLRNVTGVNTNVDMAQGVVFLSGERQQVVRALELLAILDRPGTRARNVAFVRLQYLTPEAYVSAMTELLVNEGLMTGAQTSDNRVSFVKLPQMGAVVVFSSEEEFIERVEYWTSQLDTPAQGSDRQYFIYTPRFARASDLGESLERLISGSSAATNRAQRGSTDRAAAIEGGQASQIVAENEGLRMVVDERANTLIFHSSGSQYQQIIPLIERLDIMPRQVLLELTIAEVTLTDEFRFGVDAAFSSGRFSGSSNFGGSQIGGGVLGWISGTGSIDAQAFESNRLVNVLSKPTLLVRDGMDASILVGTDIPVVGKTTTDPTTGTTRSVEYRTTGIEVNVTPTVNAQGVVIMSIQQRNSNQVDGGSEVEGNPQIFERNLSTEVVAESGQTIVLGGLISENNSNSKSGIPGLRSLPVVGYLFGTISKSNVKTELVIMVTPRVINRNDEWNDIKLRLNEGLQFIEVTR